MTTVKYSDFHLYVKGPELIILPNSTKIAMKNSWLLGTTCPEPNCREDQDITKDHEDVMKGLADFQELKKLFPDLDMTIVNSTYRNTNIY